MKRQPNNNPNRHPGSKATVQILAATLALGAMLALPARGEMFRPDPTKEGGLQVNPEILSVTPSGSNNAVLTIRGLQAPYMIQVSPDNVNWQNAGVTALQHPKHDSTCLATNVPPGNAFFRLMMLGSDTWVGKYNPGALAISNVFAGQTKCVGCHSDKLNEWSGTAHAKAVDAILNADGSFKPGRNESCLPCHTVGKNQPGGFVDLATTPHLANVQCENCHGSANSHINISGRQYHPVANVTAETCGSCHTDSHHPTYEEWSESPHAHQDPHIVEYFVGSTSNDRQMSCGFCHSSATRLAMLANYEARQKGITNYLNLASVADATNSTASCVVCHDPHNASRTAQLRNPMHSTNYYTMFTGAQPNVTVYSTNVLGVVSTNVYYQNGGFASQYNPNIQVCAQCHNSRGARWDGRSKSWNAASNAMVLGTSQSFSRGPHHSVQYNILIGIAQDDYLHVNAQGVATNRYAAHSGGPRSTYNTNQCVTCHVVGYAVNAGTNVTGHSFELDTKGCALGGCHTSGTPDIEGYRIITTNNIANTVALLNQWATNYGPAIFTTNYSKYLQNSWEYNTIGALATATNAGPSGTDSTTRMPDAIKQARFNLYMVLNDGSLGVHNPGYTRYLIKDAETKVLSQFSIAKFSVTANVPNYYTNTTVTFTNLNPNVTACTWDFGDGTPTGSGLLSQTHIYTAPGQYTVTLTATDANGTETITRTQYINVINKAVADFTYEPATGTAPLTVNFTSNSQNADYYRWTFSNGSIVGGVTNSPFSNEVNPSFTYNTPGFYSVTYRAYDLVGSTTITKTNIIEVTAPFVP